MTSDVYANMIAPAVRSGESVLIISTTLSPADGEGYRVMSVSAATIVEEERGYDLLREAVEHWLEHGEEEPS